MSIFDEFDKLFEWDKRIWKEFDEMFEELRKMKPGESKSYRLTYHYETGMDAPEITVEGDVDEDTIKKFIKRAQKEFKIKLPKMKEPVIHLLESGKTKGAKTGGHKKIKLAMPGLGKDDVKVEVKDGKAIITGEKGDIKYKKIILLGFEPTETKIEADNGLFTFEFIAEEKETEGEGEKKEEEKKE